MYIFHEDLYTDVRIENGFETSIIFENSNLNDNKEREYSGAFIRVFDGDRWFYKAISNVDNIQKTIDELNVMARPNESIKDNPVVRKFQVNKDELFSFIGFEIDKVPQQEKFNFTQGLISLVKDKDEIKNWKINYKDKRIIKEFYSSKGASIKYDYQVGGVYINYTISKKDKKFKDTVDILATNFNQLGGIVDKFKEQYDKSVRYTEEYESVEPGEYTVILSPTVSGTFAHESFGHKSESDFMIGDERLMEEWKIGSKVGADILSIVDCGCESISGFIPYDDEGTRSEKTYLIRSGKLMGRLHNASSAAALDERLTGNGRAVSFEYEPIVRMTNTYIEPGDLSKEELFKGIKEGIYIEECVGGTGMSTFTISPHRSYMIRDGKIAEPVMISTLTGNVFETLHNIDGISKEYESVNNIWGGCGKREQQGLDVAKGGPYIRIQEIQVQ